ncbi:MAG: hypothetical protein Q9211_006438 [Gyalolechia sp. 1 TL-2023]
MPLSHGEVGKYFYLVVEMLLPSALSAGDGSVGAKFTPKLLRVQSLPLPPNMSPQRILATKQKPAKRISSLLPAAAAHPNGLKAIKPRVSRRLRSPLALLRRHDARLSSKRLQPQAGRSLPPSTNESVPLDSVQRPWTASRNPTKPLPTTGRKRKRRLEVECSLKRRKESEAVVKSVRELSKTNLEEHDRWTESVGGGKRTLSRRTSTVDVSQDTASVASQKSSTFANYRWINLDSARIYAENGLVPKHLQTRIDAIIQPTLDEQKEEELSAISNTFCNDFIDIMKGASREDDLVEPIHVALTSLDSGKNFLFPRKSGMSRPKHRVWHFDVAEQPIDTAVDSPNRPDKRQQAAASYVSPERSETTLPSSCIPSDNPGPPMPPPPPPAPPNQDICIVKTPRPDITIGLRDTILIAQLKAKGLRELQASDFLKALQNQQVLCSNPLRPAYPMRSPPLVVEGKSYSTGRPVFEAQNQAAVSGSCMTNLQHRLAELTKRTSPGPHQGKEPLAFSICTDGPIMQLWVHYTTLMDGEHMYNMNIVRRCHASSQPFLQEGVKDFFKAVSGVMRWAVSDFLDDIVEQLNLMWKAGQRQHEAIETG